MDVEVYAQDYVQEHVSISVKAVLDVVTVVLHALADVVEIVNLDVQERVPVDVDLDVRMDVDLDVLRPVEETVLDVKNHAQVDVLTHVLETVLMVAPIPVIQLVHLVKAVLEDVLDAQEVALLDVLHA